MRILGIDPGERRTGLAISDELGITAQGLTTFDRQGPVDFFDHISELIETHAVGEIVVGNPVHLSGRRSESSARAERLAEELQRRFDIKVTMWDERLSSQEARRVTRGERVPKEALDRVAAVLILQSYLDFKRRDV